MSSKMGLPRQSVEKQWGQDRQPEEQQSLYCSTDPLASTRAGLDMTRTALRIGCRPETWTDLTRTDSFGSTVTSEGSLSQRFAVAAERQDMDGCMGWDVLDWVT